jgi:hypothetical protein
MLFTLYHTTKIQFLWGFALVNRFFFLPLSRNVLINIMKIKEQYKVREMAGEHVVIMQGRHGKDLTKIISLNESALYLWNAIEGQEFDVARIVDLLTEYYGIDDAIAERDATRWIDKLEECGLLE